MVFVVCKKRIWISENEFLPTLNQLKTPQGVAKWVARSCDGVARSCKELQRVATELHIFCEKNSKTLWNSSATLCNSLQLQCNSLQLHCSSVPLMLQLLMEFSVGWGLMFTLTWKEKIFLFSKMAVQN